MSTILTVERMTAGYGAQDVLFDVSVSIGFGEIVAIIGPNGAGKSTLLKVIAGIVSPRSGSILFKDTTVVGKSPQHMTALGLGWVPQEDNIFPSLTVRENLEVGSYLFRQDPGERIDEVCNIFPQLRERMKQSAGSLSGGQRQMLAVARVLMMHPDLLLLDEPTAGLAPNLVQMMLEKINEIALRMGNSVLLVTQTLDALRLSSRGYLLSAGGIKYEASTDALLSNREVRDLYFGG
jgi:branched-chain amino acid transport system ATP-binding protein